MGCARGPAPLDDRHQRGSVIFDHPYNADYALIMRRPGLGLLAFRSPGSGLALPVTLGLLAWFGRMVAVAGRVLLLAGFWCWGLALPCGGLCWVWAGESAGCQVLQRVRRGAGGTFGAAAAAQDGDGAVL
jgi:hypothetical protein